MMRDIAAGVTVLALWAVGWASIICATWAMAGPERGLMTFGLCMILSAYLVLKVWLAEAEEPEAKR